MLHFKSSFPSFLNPNAFLLGNLHQYLPFGKDTCWNVLCLANCEITHIPVRVFTAGDGVTRRTQAKGNLRFAVVLACSWQSHLTCSLHSQWPWPAVIQTVPYYICGQQPAQYNKSWSTEKMRPGGLWIKEKNEMKCFLFSKLALALLILNIKIFPRLHCLYEGSEMNIQH